ncbi:hypothetical protein COJ67_22845 [Bacillus thuringiensis]|nr:hypothetical protein COJ67_22845 [Bacillus thuringiensis]
MVVLFILLIIVGAACIR